MKIKITEQQFKNLKGLLVESTIKDFLQKLKKNDIVTFEVNNKKVNLIAVNPEKKIFKNENTKHADKLYSIDGVFNNKLKVRVANAKKDKFKLNNPKNWDVQEFEIKTPINLVRNGSVIDDLTGQGGQQGNQQNADNQQTSNNQEGGQQDDGQNDSNFNELLNSPLLSKAYYKAPNLFKRLLNVARGDNKGKGVIELDDLTRDLSYGMDYRTNKVPTHNNFKHNKQVEFKYGGQKIKGRVINNLKTDIKIITNTQVFNVGQLIDKRNNIYKVNIETINSPQDEKISDEIEVLVGSGDEYGYVSEKK
jgi:hypothetical protein